MAKWIRIGSKWINLEMLYQIRIRDDGDRKKFVVDGVDEYYNAFTIQEGSEEVVEEILDKFLIDDGWNLLNLSRYLEVKG